MTENDLEQLRQYGAMFAGDADELTDERVNYSIVFDGDVDLIPVEGDETAKVAAERLDSYDAALAEAQAEITALQWRIAELKAEKAVHHE